MIKKFHQIDNNGYSIFINFQDERLDKHKLKSDLEECLYYVKQKISLKK